MTDPPLYHVAMSSTATETVGIIPCSAAKTNAPAAARNLYSSSYFRMALAAALAQTDRVLILSALHGLVELDTIIDPYDLKMGDEGSVTPATIAAQALALQLDETDVYGFLPSSYFSVLDEGLRSIDVFASPVYEATSGIGHHRGICRRVA